MSEENWKTIVAEYESKIGESVYDDDGNIYTFFGLVHGDDDFYYGLISKSSDRHLRLVSCVLPLESAGFEFD